MRIGHPHMVGWGLAALNVLVVPFAREYREFCSSRPPSATIGSESIAEFNGLRHNSLRIGTGNLIRPCRELNRAIREFFRLIRESGRAPPFQLRRKASGPHTRRHDDHGICELADPPERLFDVWICGPGNAR